MSPTDIGLLLLAGPIVADRVVARLYLPSLARQRWWLWTISVVTAAGAGAAAWGFGSNGHPLKAAVLACMVVTMPILDRGRRAA